jgi:hypothetical protein
MGCAAQEAGSTFVTNISEFSWINVQCKIILHCKKFSGFQAFGDSGIGASSEINVNSHALSSILDRQKN